MSKRIILSEKFSTAAELSAALDRAIKDVAWIHNHVTAEDIYVKSEITPELVVEEETLTDGSPVYNFTLRPAAFLGTDYSNVPHGTPEECSTYYDGCHCTVETLENMIELLEDTAATLTALREQEKWIPIQDSPPEWEGTFVLWSELKQEPYIRQIPKGFSRKPEHCGDNLVCQIPRPK